MSGLYIHIPFCKSRCIYCDFYSTTQPLIQTAYIDAICHEMQLRKDYLPNRHINTIYIGGGTPSQLSCDNLKKIFTEIFNDFEIDSDAEITMECNPDDISAQYAETILSLPVNRISMGAQTFNDKRLKFLHRRHTSSQISDAVTILRGIGIKNISIDLMYGFPDETIENWEEDINQAIRLNVEHISAYSLMYEEGTPLYGMLQRKEIKEVDEEVSRTMYERLIDRLTSTDYLHYEISNFAHNGYQSRHNSSYWKQIPYLGIGAAAHSFDIQSRQWNISDVRKYIDSIHENHIPFEKETLSPQMRYNDTVFTALRTSEGVNLDQLRSICGDRDADYCLRMAQQHISNGLMKIEDHHLKLCHKGIFVSDDIMSDLMIVD